MVSVWLRFLVSVSNKQIDYPTSTPFASPLLILVHVVGRYTVLSKVGAEVEEAHPHLKVSTDGWEGESGSKVK